MDSIIQQKSRSFAIRIINCYKFLTEQKHEQIMSKQSIVQNPAFMRAANALYYDAEGFRARKGSGGEGAGAARYFVQTIDQLSMTRDFFDPSMTTVLNSLGYSQR